MWGQNKGLFRKRRIRLDRIFQKIWAVFRGILIIGISFIIIYPILNQLSFTFMTANDLVDSAVRYIPREVTYRNIEVAFDKMDYFQALFNTFVVSSLLSVLQLGAALIIGYGFARFEFRGSNILFSLVILSLLIPPSLIMLPLFLNFRFFTIFGILEEPGINLIGSSWPLAMLALTGTAHRNGLYIFIVRQYFKGMSNTLEEAAYVDGAGPLKTFYRIMVPNATPILLIIFLFSFVWQWNDLFYSDLFLRGQSLLSLNLQQMTSAYQQQGVDPMIEGAHIANVSNAAILMYLIPLLGLYSLMQRYFVESIERTGIVG
ncbi:MAG: carbohydrate ABC transporter permease [Bacillota bacterium]